MVNLRPAPWWPNQNRSNVEEFAVHPLPSTVYRPPSIHGTLIAIPSFAYN